ncbi:hypothetical protein L6452_34478 [Arctium lappa]|uniref:Uncharacterized protein n=1 Tax=Arctium lappa TaxID=4217 RepID=A0ACB8YMK0_ARCLA|nr:hypothetical protein L6452_34478 [Arctium lappa]
MNETKQIYGWSSSCFHDCFPNYSFTDQPLFNELNNLSFRVEESHLLDPALEIVRKQASSFIRYVHEDFRKKEDVCVPEDDGLPLRK